MTDEQDMPITAEWLSTQPFTRTDTEYTINLGNNHLLVDLFRGDIRVSVTGHTYHDADGTVHFPAVRYRGQLLQLISLLKP
jgi:hypothetical protein